MTPAQVLDELKWHVGELYGIRAEDLVRRITGQAHNAAAERRLRACITELRLDGHHVCGHPRSGYYLAATAEELDQTCKFLVDRSMTGLQQVSRMKRIAMPDLYGQLKVPT